MKKSEQKILFITSWEYTEGLIQSSTLPYLSIIHQINPFAKFYLLTEEKKNWDLQEKKKVREALLQKKIVWLPKSHHAFGANKIIEWSAGFVKLWWFIMSKRITHLHCFCTVAGGIGYLLSILTGAKLIIDSYEPHAESMVENGTWSKDGSAFKLLWNLEKAQTKRASYLIAAASGMKEYARQKYDTILENWGVRPACVDLKHFQFNQFHRDLIRKKLEWEDKIVAVYAGKFGGIYLDKEVFDFLKVAEKFWGEKLRLLLLTNHEPDEIKQFCGQSGFPYEKVHLAFVSHHEVTHYLSAADFALTPVKPVPSKRYCTPIKDGEYWAIGLPVVITKNISDDSEIIERENAGAVLECLDTDSYKKALCKIDLLLKEPKQDLRKRIRRLAETYRNYDIAVKQYEKIYGVNN